MITKREDQDRRNARRRERRKIDPEYRERDLARQRERRNNPVFAEAARQRTKDWRTKYPERHEDAKLRWHYGISREDRLAMLLDQDGRCAVCGALEGELMRKLHVDHNHTTGQVRGLLCQNCNTALGLLKEEENRIMNLFLYIRNTQGYIAP